MNNQIYDYNLLLEVTDHLHDNEYIESHDIDWNKLHIKTIDSITEKLISLDDDEKRTFFLGHIFTRIFIDNNCDVLSKSGLQFDSELREKLRVQYETEQSKPVEERTHFYGEQSWSELLVNDEVFEYVCKCDLLLMKVIMDVSELCMKYKYDEVDFNLIISLALMPYSREGMGRMRYIWNRPDGTCNQDFGAVAFCPKTEVDNYMLKYKDELDALDGAPKAKAKRKPKEVITTFEDAVISKEHLDKIYSFLASYEDPIDGKRLFTVGASKLVYNKYDFKLGKGQSARLYRCLRRFEDEGYFKKMTATKLHPLVNEKFKTDVDIQSWIKAIPYVGQIE